MEQYRNIQHWGSFLETQPTPLPLAKAIELTQELMPQWDNFVYYTWGDKAAQKLLDFYKEDVWLEACASYFIRCMDDLTDDLNEETTLWRYSGLLRQLGPHFISTPSTNPLVVKWQELRKGTAQPQTITQHWARFLLDSADSDLAANRLAELLALPGATLPVDPAYMVQVSQHIRGNSLFSEGSPLYIKCAPELAASSFWKWINNSVDTLKQEGTRELLQLAETEPLLKWYCLGMLNPRTHTSQMNDSSYRDNAGKMCETFILNQAPWFQTQPDLVLDAILQAHQKLTSTFGINRFAWLETWLVTVQNPDSNYDTGMLMELVDTHDVLCWLKPEWQAQQSAAQAMGCEFRELVALCRAAKTTISPGAQSQLPDSLSL